MRSSYKIIKSNSSKEKKDACVIPIHEVEKETYSGVMDPIQKANLKAETILNEAKCHAAKIKEEVIKKSEIDAQFMIEELKKKAYNEAYKLGFQEGSAKGFEQGVNEGQQQGDAIRKQAKFVLQNAHQLAHDMMDKNEEEIIDLAVHIAKKVLLKSISENDKYLIAIARDACMELKNKDQIIIRIHPTKGALFSSNMEIFQGICPNTVFSVLEDEMIDETGCIIETDTQVIDTQIAGQLEAVKEALLKTRLKDEE